MYYNILKYSHQYTPSQAASFARFEAQNVLAVKNLVEEEGIDCDFVLTRAVDVYLDEEHSRATLENFGKLKELGKADLGDVEVLEGREAEEVSFFFLFFIFSSFLLVCWSVVTCLPHLPEEGDEDEEEEEKRKKRQHPIHLRDFFFLFSSRENYTNPTSSPKSTPQNPASPTQQPISIPTNSSSISSAKRSSKEA